MSPELLRWACVGGIILVVWLGAAACLFGAGVILSRSTLAEAERALASQSGSPNACEHKLHRAYAWVLWLCCAYYYASWPVVLLAVISIAAAMTCGLIAVEFTPPIVLILGLTIVTISSLLASMFARGEDHPPGERLDLDEAPGLQQMLERVANKIGTRRVDHVYIEPETNIAVFERGGMLDKLRGKGERCLVLGVAALEGMDSHALEAILAHEFGHFSNQDTAGGDVALHVRRSISKGVSNLAEYGEIGMYTPAWLFLRGFSSLFLHISQGASRLKELLADRWAATVCGADSFERGLRHVITVEMQFDLHANSAIAEILDGRRCLRNIYRYQFRGPWPVIEDLASRVEEAVNAEPSAYDSHPRPADRFRWARAVAPSDLGDTPPNAPAWSLFADPVAIQERMTDIIRAHVEVYTGVTLWRGDDAG